MPGTRKEIYIKGINLDKSDYDHITVGCALHQNISGGSTSKYVARKPKDPNNWSLQLIMLKEPTIWETPKDEKWCPQCGDWRHKSWFSEHKGRGDGLRGWCKTCEAADKRRREWLEKDSEKLMAEWEKRHILRPYPEPTKTKRIA